MIDAPHPRHLYWAASLAICVIAICVAWANIGVNAPKPVAPITINVTVQKPEHVAPTLKALTGSLPKLEERK